MIDESLTVDPLVNQHQNDKSPSATWLQTPPSQMPWSIPLANQPTIMRFTGDSSLPIPNPSGYTNHAFEMGQSFTCENTGPCKRKLRLYEGFEEMRPKKQLITEEKMAANLEGLHLSSNYVAHQCGSMSSNEFPDTTTAQKNPQGNHMRTLVLCDELRRLTSEPVIPPAVIAKLERPTNALVLWQPPAGTLGAKLQQIINSCKELSNELSSKSSWNSITNINNNNNNSSFTEDMNDPDLNKERQDSRNTVQDDTLMEI